MSDEEVETTAPRVRRKKTARKKTADAAPAAESPGFIDWEEPPVPPLPDGGTWKTRLPVLRDHYLGEWAKYGPFSGSMVKSSETTCHKNANNLGITVETQTRVDGDDGYLYVKVTG